jgi:5,5'-dehydrodivanillate O-demethylase oxygenase subunit
MTQHEDQHQSRLDLLVQSGPDTLMGKLLRRFWHPIAIAESLPAGRARALRILCEDLTLFRGGGGTPFLVGGRCAHRCTELHTGWVEDDQIRCMYHGWRYDGSGQCTEMPAERHTKPETVKIEGYPVREYAGLIFTYMGPLPAPSFELARNPVLEDAALDTSAHEEVWDCNWFQQIENSLDSTHLSFVHQWPNATRLGAEIGAAIPELQYEETSSGIRQTAIRPSGVRISNWTFPNCNNVLGAPARAGDPWSTTVAWQVPIDDENTLRITLKSYPGGEIGAAIRANGGVFQSKVMESADILFSEHRLPDHGPADLVRDQDYAAVRGQSRIHDRKRERLGASDAGIALARRIFFREMEAIRSGAPTKQWSKSQEPVVLHHAVGAG